MGDGAAWDRILLVSVCAYAIALHTQYPSRRNLSPKSADRVEYRRNKPLSESARPANITDNQMGRGKGKKISKKNQGWFKSLEPSSPTTTSLEYPMIPEKQDSD